MARTTVGMKKVSFGISNDVSYKGQKSKHAEVDAINKIYKKKNLPKKLDIFVIRLTDTGILRESRPCLHCINNLLTCGLNIKNVYYSNANGKIMREKIHKMKNHPATYISSGSRAKYRSVHNI